MAMSPSLKKKLLPALIAAGIVIVQILPEPKKPPVAEPFSL